MGSNRKHLYVTLSSLIFQKKRQSVYYLLLLVSVCTCTWLHRVSGARAAQELAQEISEYTPTTSLPPEIAPPSERDAGKSTQETISLEIINMDIIDVLKLIARKGKFNLIIGRNVRGKITLFLENVSVWNALKTVLDTNDLAYIRHGKIIQVMTAREYEAAAGVPFQDKRAIKVVHLRHTKALDMGQILKQLNSKIGNVVVNEQTNSLILVDSPNVIEKMENALKKLDVPTKTHVFFLKHAAAKNVEESIKPLISRVGTLHIDTVTNRIVIKDIAEVIDNVGNVIQEYDKEPYLETVTVKLQYAKFDEVETKIKEHLTKDLGKVLADERTNKVTITDLPEKVKAILEIVDELDERSQQVLIEAKIVQVTLNDEFRFGINWETMIEKWRKRNLNFTAITASAPVASNIGTALVDHIEMVDGLTSNKIDHITDKGEIIYKPYPFKYPFPVPKARPGATIIGSGTINQTDAYTLVVNMLKHVGKTKLLSSPRILVLNGQEANMKIGREEPIITSTVIHGDKTTTTDDVTNVSVGITLSVKPTINDDGMITMEIIPGVSSVVAFRQAASGNQYPVIEEQRIDTRVMVKDGCTVIMGGLIQSRKHKEVNKVPFFGSLPIVGALFRQTFQETSNNELVIFLTPRIVTGDMNYADATQDITDFLKQTDEERISTEIKDDIKTITVPMHAKEQVAK